MAQSVPAAAGRSGLPAAGAATPGYLRRTACATTQVINLRLKLLKIDGMVIRNTRRVRLMLSSHYPDQDLFLKLAK
jgi:hypothetical protein